MKQPPQPRSHDDYLRRIRALVKKLPDTGETQSWGHPNFTTNGRIFASCGVYHERATLSIATSLLEQSFLVQDPRFTVAPYVGKYGWVSVPLDLEPEWGLLLDLLQKAHARVHAKGPARKRAAAVSARTTALPSRRPIKPKSKPKAKVKAQPKPKAR